LPASAQHHGLPVGRERADAGGSGRGARGLCGPVYARLHACPTVARSPKHGLLLPHHGHAWAWPHGAGREAWPWPILATRTALPFPVPPHLCGVASCGPGAAEDRSNVEAATDDGEGSGDEPHGSGRRRPAWTVLNPARAQGTVDHPSGRDRLRPSIAPHGWHRDTFGGRSGWGSSSAARSSLAP
jgi:hypothetical protein